MSARRYLRAGVCTECRPARRAMAERVTRCRGCGAQTDSALYCDDYCQRRAAERGAVTDWRRRWLDTDWPLVVSGVLLVVACVLMGVTI